MSESTFKTTLCKRCRCKFMFDTDVFRCRKYCDSCAPIAKAEIQAQFAARRKENAKRLKPEGNNRLTDSLAHYTVMSYAEVGAIMGISAEAVRQAEISALNKARRLLGFNNLKIGMRRYGRE